MTIRYKIITKDGFSAYVKNNFMIRYKKGELITARPDTLGIFVYELRCHAEKELHSDISTCDPITHKIIKVQAHGRGRKLLMRPKVYTETIITQLGKNKKKFLQKQGTNILACCPVLDAFDFLVYYDGTMLYDSVTPLE